MNTNPFTDQQLLSKAVKQLGLGDGYAITYAATHVAHLVDADDVTSQLDELDIGIYEVQIAVNNACVAVKLPAGMMLVGLQKADGTGGGYVHYTFVNYPDRTDRQTAILRWANTTFGAETADVTGERIRRFLEEAIELSQAVGLEQDDVENMVEYVFARPAGAVAREIGQVGVSLLALAEHLNINAEHEERTEFERIASLPADHWQARQNAKADKGMGLASTAE